MKTQKGRWLRRMEWILLDRRGKEEAFFFERRETFQGGDVGDVMKGPRKSDFLFICKPFSTKIPHASFTALPCMHFGSRPPYPSRKKIGPSPPPLAPCPLLLILFLCMSIVSFGLVMTPSCSSAYILLIPGLRGASSSPDVVSRVGGRENSEL